MSFSLPSEFQPASRSVVDQNAFAAEPLPGPGDSFTTSLPVTASFEDQLAQSQLVFEPSGNAASDQPQDSSEPDTAESANGDVQFEDLASDSNGLVVLAPSELGLLTRARVETDFELRFEPPVDLPVVAEPTTAELTTAELEALNIAQQLVGNEQAANLSSALSVSTAPVADEASALVASENRPALPIERLLAQKNTSGDAGQTESIVSQQQELAFDLDSSTHGTQSNLESNNLPTGSNTEGASLTASAGTDSVIAPFSQTNLIDELTAPVASRALQAEVNQIVSERVSQTLVQEIQTIENAQTRQITLELHPAELGRLTIHVSLDNDVVRAQIVASEATTSDLLNRDKNLLLETLDAQGLDFGSFEVSYDGAQNQRQFDARPGRSTFTFDAENQDPQTTRLPNLQTHSQGAVVDVIA